jgi:hypothetical protein
VATARHNRGGSFGGGASSFALALKEDNNAMEINQNTFIELLPYQLAS